jgi:hypothetical protein
MLITYFDFGQKTLFTKYVFLLLFMVTLGSWLRNTLQEGSADAVARLPVPWA